MTGEKAKRRKNPSLVKYLVYKVYWVINGAAISFATTAVTVIVPQPLPVFDVWKRGQRERERERLLLLTRHSHISIA